MKNWLLSGLMFLVVSIVFSQGKVTGTITDGQGFLPGANVAIKGTATSTSTDFDGKFSINTSAKSGELVISFIGYDNKIIKFTVSNGATTNLGTIVLTSNSNQLQEIIVRSSIIDVAKDRKTPVAVSTIRAAEIQEKLGTQEFPEILANTPSVYATKSGGGFGDSRITIRGFNQNNIAVMINGVPVNDMENSSVYWSNWAGLSDVATSVQVQRGLGSSKIVNSAVGGNVNIITRTSEMKQGGSVSSTFGNANYLKTQASYSTGKMTNGFSASVLLSQTFGDGYIDGTKFAAGNYFIALGYDINKKNNIQLSFTGAPQWHDQRTTSPSITQYLQYGSNGEPNRRLNLDAGQWKGEAFNMKTNYYDKPVASLNWDYKISEKTKFSTVLYGSWGRGGGSTASGGIVGKSYTDINFANADGSRNYDKIYAWNTGQPITILSSTGIPVVYKRTLTNGQFVNSNAFGSTADKSTGISKIASTNSHDWYGGVASLNTKLTKEITLDFGIDLRTYKGIHFQTVSDNLGAYGYKDVLSATNGNINAPQPNIITATYAVRPNLNPFWNTDYQQKVNYYNDSKVNWLGAFTQLEYSKDNLTAFVQGAISQEGYKRIDHFRFTNASGSQETSFKNILGGNFKAGLNYNINENHNVYVNSGYYSKQPFMNAVYTQNRNFVNENLTNEKILGFEAGYGFRSVKFNANLNLYRTTWKDRFQSVADNTLLPTPPNPANTKENPDGYFSYEGLNETHQGVELDFNYKPLEKLTFNGMLSIGNWFYNGNATSTRYTVTNQIFGAGSSVLYLDKVKVGNAAQTTASIGATYEVVKRVKVDANYRYENRLYAGFDATKLTSATNKGALELPSYGLVDAGFSYKMLVGKNKDNSVNFRLNVNNVFDTVYIAESSSNVFADDIKTPAVGTTPAVTYQQAGALYKGLAIANQVYFGFGRTWNFSLRYNF